MLLETSHNSTPRGNCMIHFPKAYSELLNFATKRFACARNGFRPAMQSCTWWNELYMVKWDSFAHSSFLYAHQGHFCTICTPLFVFFFHHTALHSCLSVFLPLFTPVFLLSYTPALLLVWNHVFLFFHCSAFLLSCCLKPLSSYCCAFLFLCLPTGLKSCLSVFPLLRTPVFQLT